MTKTVKVKIGPIYVSKISGDSRGYYNFDYWIYENGKMMDYGNYDGSFTIRTAEAFRKVLKRGYAFHLILGKYYA